MAYAPEIKKKYGLSSEVIKKYAPPTWTAMCPSEAVKLVTLSPKSQEFRTAYEKVKSSMPKMQVKEIVRVQNPYLWGVYLLKRAENPNVRELTLFHATEAANVPFVTANNLEFNGILIKHGVRFGGTADGAELCADLPRTSNRAMILARVLDTPPSVPSEIPFHLRRIGSVYLKEDYNEYYPEYVVYHYFKDPMAIYDEPFAPLAPAFTF